MKPWPGAPDWMDDWDGVEPLATFILRVGPVEDVSGLDFQVFEDDV